MSITGAIATKLMTKFAKKAYPDVLKAVKKFVRNDNEAELLSRKISGELSKTELAGSIETRNAEVNGTHKQRSWRPDWMYMLRNILYYYYASTITMLLIAFIFGIARGKTWPTDNSAMEFYGIWLGIGAMLTTLTTASFAIYGYRRSSEKIAYGEPATNVIDSIADFLRPNGAREPSANPKRRVPVVRTSPQARRRLDKALDSNPTRLDAERKVARQRIDVELDSEQDVYVPTPTGEPVRAAIETRPTIVGHRIEVEQRGTKQ